MKKLSFITVFVFLSILFVQAQQAKYVFYFIGDGMGVNQVLGTEMYRGELEGKIGVTPLLFTQFPYATIATTFSATNGVTDSAAAGTALATGNKTKNGALYNPQIQISAESETKRSIFRKRDKTKRSKKESAQHSKSRNKSFVMTSVSAL